MASFWSFLDCVSGTFTGWNPDSGTVTKIYNAMNKAKTAGDFSCDVVLVSGASKQAELTVRKLRQLGYQAALIPWADNQIRVSVSWEP